MALRDVCSIAKGFVRMALVTVGLPALSGRLVELSVVHVLAQSIVLTDLRRCSTSYANPETLRCRPCKYQTHVAILRWCRWRLI